jgi:hypothetical protein
MTTRKKANTKQALKGLKARSLKPSEARSVRGGKGTIDIKITRPVDKGSP